MPEAFVVIKTVLKALFLLGWARGWEGELSFSWALKAVQLAGQTGFRPLGIFLPTA